MRKVIILFLPVLLAVALPAAAQETELPEPETTWGDRVAFSDRIVVPADTVHRGSITSITGEVEIEGSVTGDVVLIGGSLRLDGAVGGEVVAVLADVSITEDSTIDGSLVAVAGSMDDRGARIRRDRVNIPLGLSLPGLGHPLEVLFSIFLWWMLLGLVLMFIAVLVLAALVPERLELISQELPVRWPGALLLGLAFSVIAMPLIYILLLISVIGIPLIPFAYFTFLVLKWMGIAGLFLFVGRKLGAMTGRSLTLLPGALLGFLLFALVKLVPVVGFLVWLLLGWIGIGMVLLTRFGKQRKQVPISSPPPPAQAAPPPEATPEG